MTYKYRLNRSLGINRASVQGITLFRDRWTEFPEIEKTLELYEFVEREDKIKEEPVIQEIIKEQIPEAILTEKPKRGRKKKVEETINAKSNVNGYSY